MLSLLICEVFQCSEKQGRKYKFYLISQDSLSVICNKNKKLEFLK